MYTGLDKTAVWSSGTRRFYAWASDFPQPLAQQASSYLFNEMKVKGFNFKSLKICEAGQEEECLGQIARHEVYLTLMG